MVSSILPENERKKIQIYYYGTPSRIFFIHILGELKTPKKTFQNLMMMMVSSDEDQMEMMVESAGPGWDASPSGAYIFTSGKTVVTIQLTNQSRSLEKFVPEHINIVTDQRAMNFKECDRVSMTSLGSLV